ncbi:polysaccharide biosynthesis protein VpsM [Candidatus Magnetomoraceae bacterium gMMP-1]
MQARYKIYKNLIFLYLIITLCFFLPESAYSKYLLEVTPIGGFSLSYDDNILLDKKNKQSDITTHYSPGIKAKITSQRTSLDLDYSLSKVTYEKHDENNTIRHSGTLNIQHQLNKYLIFNLKENYLQSEDPLDKKLETVQLQLPTGEVLEAQIVRDSRNVYKKNALSANINYQFGDDNYFKIEYNHLLSENQDPDVDDSSELNPSLNLKYWFNIRNGIDLNYKFIRDEFKRENTPASGDDFDEHKASIKYIHRFSQRTQLYVEYALTARDFKRTARDFKRTARNFKRDSEDYKVHNASIGYNHAMSELVSFSMNTGYYTQKKNISGNEQGITYSANLKKTIEKGSLGIGVKGGWDEGFFEDERKDFTTFWSVNGSIGYNLMENLSAGASVSYRQNKDENGFEYNTYGGNLAFNLKLEKSDLYLNTSYNKGTDQNNVDYAAFQTSSGINMPFFRWLYLKLDYTNKRRISDINDDEYIDNRVLMTINVSDSFYWEY